MRLGQFVLLGGNGPMTFSRQTVPMPLTGGRVFFLVVLPLLLLALVAYLIYSFVQRQHRDAADAAYRNGNYAVAERQYNTLLHEDVKAMGASNSDDSMTASMLEEKLALTYAAEKKLAEAAKTFDSAIKHELARIVERRREHSRNISTPFNDFDLVRALDRYLWNYLQVRAALGQGDDSAKVREDIVARALSMSRRNIRIILERQMLKDTSTRMKRLGLTTQAAKLEKQLDDVQMESDVAKLEDSYLAVFGTLPVPSTAAHMYLDTSCFDSAK